jgi:DNA-binding transcriptional MocR family regulator
MIELAPGTDEREIVAIAARRSIRLAGVGPCRATAGPPALLLGYGGLEESVIPEAVRQLALLLREHDGRAG